MIHAILGIESEVFEADGNITFVIRLQDGDRVRRGGAELPPRGLVCICLYESIPNYNTCGWYGRMTIRCHSTRRTATANTITIAPSADAAFGALARITQSGIEFLLDPKNSPSGWGAVNCAGRRNKQTWKKSIVGVPWSTMVPDAGSGGRHHVATQR